MTVIRVPGFGFKGKKISIGTPPGGGSGGLDPTPFNPAHVLAPALNIAQSAPFHSNGVQLKAATQASIVTDYSTILNTELPDCLTIKQIKHRYYWNFFENMTPGSYNFSMMLGHLADAKANGLKMHVLLALTISRGNDWNVNPSIAPRYMVTGSSTGAGTDGKLYQGGQWGYGSAIGGAGGFRIRIANGEVQARWYAMLTEMCEQLKAHAAFDALEAICFSESAVGTAVAPYSSPGAQETFDALVGACDVIQAAIPNRLVYCSVNHPVATSGNTNNNIEYLLAKMQASGRKYGFGTPNICPGDEDLNAAPNANGFGEGPLPKMPRYTGARIPEVQPADFYWSQIQYNRTDYPYAPTYTFGGDYIPTMQQLYDKAASLNPHYVVWTRDTVTNPQTGVKYHTAMYNFLKNKPVTGGLVTTRPSVYPT